VINDHEPVEAWHHGRMTLVRQSLLVLAFALCAFAGVVGAWAVYLLLFDEPSGLGRDIGMLALVPAIAYGAVGVGLALFVRRRARRG
jgi:hypothetical protein